jgi:V/A-type H+-transporting ATPase subunit I
MIVAMKKARIVVLKQDSDALIKSLQKKSVFMPVTKNRNHTNINDPQLQKVQGTLKLIKKYEGKQKFVVDPNIVSMIDYENISPEHLNLVEQIEFNDSEIIRLKSEISYLDSEIDSIAPFNELDINLQDRFNVKYVKIYTGFIFKRNLEKAKELIADVGGIFNDYGLKGGTVAIMFTVYFEDLAVIELIRNLGFTEYDLPIVDNTISGIIENLEADKANYEARIIEHKETLEELANERKSIELLTDQLLSEEELRSVKPTETIQTMFLEGWVRVDQIDVFEKTVEDAVEIYDLEIVDAEEGELAPTATKNNWFVSSYEYVTDMFSTPRPDEIDPNPVMSPWYWFIFGMMMGDTGYGLVMMLLFAFLIKAKKPKGNSLRMYRSFIYAGVSTIFWGVMFGSYFGFELFPPVIFIPMNKPLEMLVLSLIIGAAHIITGLATKAYSKIKAKQYFDALCDDISWILIIIGLGLAFIPQTSTIGIATAIGGAVLIIFTGGRSKPSLIGKITGGATSLYGVTGYMSDILSYSRILALSLSTAIIGMVMNMLAGMLQSNPIGFVLSFVVYIIGHIFNIAMGLLSAYVHDSRLQYIEFFGKFFEGGGYQFKPLSPSTKYIYEIEK